MIVNRIGGPRWHTLRYSLNEVRPFLLNAMTRAPERIMVAKVIAPERYLQLIVAERKLKALNRKTKKAKRG